MQVRELLTANQEVWVLGEGLGTILTLQGSKVSVRCSGKTLTVSDSLCFINQDGQFKRTWEGNQVAIEVRPQPELKLVYLGEMVAIQKDESFFSTSRFFEGDQLPLDWDPTDISLENRLKNWFQRIHSARQVFGSPLAEEAGSFVSSVVQEPTKELVKEPPPESLKGLGDTLQKPVQDLVDVLQKKPTESIAPPQEKSKPKPDMVKAAIEKSQKSLQKSLTEFSQESPEFDREIDDSDPEFEELQKLEKDYQQSNVATQQINQQSNKDQGGGGCGCVIFVIFALIVGYLWLPDFTGFLTDSASEQTVGEHSNEQEVQTTEESPVAAESPASAESPVVEESVTSAEFQLTDKGQALKDDKTKDASPVPEEDDIMDIYEKANKHSEKNEYEQSVKLYTQVIEILPTHGWSYASRGSVYLDMKKYKEAEADLNKALSLNRHLKSEEQDKDLEGWVHFNLGYMYFQLNRCKESNQHYQLACKLGQKEACDGKCE